MANDLTHLDVKIVPGASHDSIAGWLGSRLKIRVQAPPEGGRANARVLEVLAAALRIPESDIVIVRGAGSPRKTVGIRGLTIEAIRAKLAS